MTVQSTARKKRPARPAARRASGIEKSPASKRLSISPALRRRLLDWFDREKRDMPWRETDDPYAIWLSEIMLQQTQVATVIPYYERFLDRFPTVRDLADANSDELLRLWSGLGYYARARNMHRAALAVVERFGGRFPRTVAGLRELPGVGPYTAGAVASIAFKERAAVVDGNVARVLARIFNIRADVRAGRGRERLWRIAERLVPADRPGDFNQALMELGATLCLPKGAAKCEACPIRTLCSAARYGVVASLPVMKKITALRAETHVVAAVESRGEWLFVRRPAMGMWGGLWELPTVVLPSAKGASAKRSNALASESTSTSKSSTARTCSSILQELSGSKSNSEFITEPFCDMTHQLTHRTIRFVGHVCRFRRRPPVSGRAHQWLSLGDAERLGLSTAMRKIIVALTRCGSGVSRA